MIVTHLKLDDETKNQINQCLNLVKEIFGQDLLGVYLYGSSILGGLQKYSDIDLLVVTNRASTHEEKTQLATQLLQISGVYMVSTKLPIEMTLVEKAEINPWHYPPNFDFQYGDWLREQFESGIIEPWSTKEMPDLALLITQVLLASKTLFGADADQLLCRVPYKDFMIATTDALQNLMSELNSDTRNVLLTLSRIWSTVATDSIRSKPAAADWAIDRLPEQYHPVMKRAKAICNGVEKEHWDDLGELIKPCADFIIGQINNKVIEIELSNNTTKSIKLAEPRMFKADWEKTSVTCQLQEGLVEKMVRLVYPDKKLSSHELIAGGCANLNIKILLEDEKHPLILRVYLRDKEAAYREQKLAALLKQAVPVPLTYYIGELEDYPFAITEFMPGMPLRDLLLGDAPHDLSAIMHELGTILSKIAGHEFTRSGFFDQELQVIPYESSDVIKFAQECLDHKTVLAVLTHEMILKIRNVLALQYGHLFPDENEKHLVHGDFDPANILVEKVNGTWGVTGILDWEFAFSGSVLWDAANMLRYAHKMPPEFESSFIEALKKSGIKLQNTWRTTIHLLNLSSLLDCLKRADFKNHPNRCADILELIEHILSELNFMKKIDRIEVVPYDPNWPTIFETEATKIKQALGNNCIAIHHVGSTSVPGLAAKPIIDIVPVVRDILALDQNTSGMEALGYEAKGEYGMLFRRYFQKKGFNVHIFEQSSAEIDGHLLFRNWMREHADDREHYATLKQDLALLYPNDIYQYVFGKDAFVKTIHSKTGFNGLRVVKALTPREWACAKHFRDTYFFGPHGIDDPYTWTFDHSEHAHLILYQGTEIIGYTHIQFWSDSRAAIRIIAIDEGTRLKNTGSTFLVLIEKWLKSLGVKSIHAESRQTSLRFYLKNSYTEMPFNDPEGHESDPHDIPVGKIL